MKHTLILALPILLLGSCAKDINPRHYADAQVGETSTTYAGVIINVRDVVVTAGDEKDGLGTGAIIGGAAGGLGGNQAGGGSGQVAATVGGVILGAALGNLLEGTLKEQPGVEYVLRLADGSLKTVVQGIEPRFDTGQAVYLVIGAKGRSRLIPAT